MAIFRTMYQLPDGERLRTTVYARDGEHLREVMALRKMGETCTDGPGYGINAIEPPKMASELLALQRLAAANHALTWTAMIGARAGVADAWALMNDHGILHQVAHLMHSHEDGQDRRFLNDQVLRLIPQIEAFERSVPGVHPCWGGSADAQVASSLYAQALEQEQVAHRAQMYRLMQEVLQQRQLAPVFSKNFSFFGGVV